MKRIISVWLGVALLAMLFTACGTLEAAPTPAVTATPESIATATPEQAPTPEEPVTFRLAGLTGPTTMGLVKLLADADAGLTENEYEFTLAGSADELTPKFVQGEIDIMAIPVNLGAILNKNTQGGLQMLSISVLGVTYIVEKGGESIQSIADLRGQTIYATGKGSTPEYALKYLLEQAGLDPETDVTIEWKSEPAEIVALMSAQERTIAMLPQPYVTVAQGQVEGLRVAVDMSAAWNDLNNGSLLITAGIFVRTAFAEQYPQQLETFLEEYAASVVYVNDYPAEAAVLVEEIGIIKAAVAEKAIPHCHITSITGESMKGLMENYYQILFDANPAVVGGEMPGGGFYYGA